METVAMPWRGPDEPANVSAMYDAHDALMWTDPAVSHDPDARWHVEVSWQPDGDVWRPLGVALRSATGEPVNASVWRHVPVTRAIRWTRAVLEMRGALAADSLSGQGRQAEADAMRAREMTERPASDGRVRYDAEHWARVVWAYEQARGTGTRNVRREVARLLATAYPDAPEYRGITAPGSTAVKGWLDRLARDGRIDRSANTRGRQ